MKVVAWVGSIIFAFSGSVQLIGITPEPYQWLVTSACLTVLVSLIICFVNWVIEHP